MLRLETFETFALFHNTYLSKYRLKKKFIFNLEVTKYIVLT